MATTINYSPQHYCQLTLIFLWCLSITHSKVKGGWHKDLERSLNIKRIPPKRATSQKAAPKKAASKKIVPKEEPKKLASKKAARKAAPKKVTKGASKGDPVQGILKLMADNAQDDVTDVKEQDILNASGYSCRDSKGFRTVFRTLSKELGYVTRATKNNVMAYTLTEKGRNHLLETGLLVVAAEPKSNEEYFDKLKLKLERVVTAPEGKLQDVFDLLQDGEYHSMEDLLSASGYGSKDSKGFKTIMSGMRKLNLLEKKGKNLRFSDAVFKFGRP